MIAEEAHLPLVNDETFEAAQRRFSTKGRGNGNGHSKNGYVLSGMVRCCCGHGPMAMAGKRRKGHTYYVCEYAASYGDTAALEAHGDQRFISAREDRLLRLVLRFFEQRIFGPLRLERLEKQLRAEARSQRQNGKLAGTKLRQRIAELERRIKAQVQALEAGSSRSWSQSASPSFAPTRRRSRRRWPRSGSGQGDRGRGAGQAAGEAARSEQGAGRGAARGPAPGLRGFRAADRLRQGRRAC